MPNTYTIYLVNNGASTQNFWCFLAAPEELVADPGVFANSSAYLAVDPGSPGTNTFTIPVQYVVGAGASNHAVGLNVQISSSVTNPASLQDTWNANYATVPPQKGPSMALAGTKAPTNSIAIVSNGFAKISNEEAGWFSNQSFGIETAAGFIGMTWSPDPQQTRTVTPKLTFYVSTGDYGANTLASWNDVSNNAAVIQVPSSFHLNKCTVTYTETGDWVITPGEPPALALARDLDWFRSPAHQELVALAHFSNGDLSADTLKSVTWDNLLEDGSLGNPVVSGTVTVTTALGAAFTYFVLSGVQFSIDKPAAGATTFHFSYSGTKSSSAVKSLFTAGAKLLFGGAK
jgi:hypothetical protein